MSDEPPPASGVASGAAPDAARIAANLAVVRERVEAATRAAGRPPGAVTLVVVTKSVGVDAVAAVLRAGARDLGENRAQELLAKAGDPALGGGPAFGDDGPGGAPVWHFIGRLQRNKVRALAPVVAWWHSVDRAELGAEIARHAPGARVYVQVNVAGEAQKGGCAPGDASAIVDGCRERGLVVEGLMTVPPAGSDPRPVFRALRAQCDTLGLEGCSMGMSGDFEVAISEGATVVRVGTSVFGARPDPPPARR